ncbi:hypothetical protein [Cellulomonas flavigena]|nr:hypothetical protein [Cellulomonas flavigena]
MDTTRVPQCRARLATGQTRSGRGFARSSPAGSSMLVATAAATGRS